MDEIMIKLKELRKSRKLSQAEVANFLGVEQSTYARWEKGKGEISVKALVNACILYDVTIEYLLNSLFEESRKKASLLSATL